MAFGIAEGIALTGILAGVGTSVGSGVAQGRMNRKTRELQSKQWKQNFKYQKKQNKINMERQDTTYQRTVKDMKAAGLNPVLAAGQAQVAPSMPAPQDMTPYGEMEESGRNLATKKEIEAQQQLSETLTTIQTLNDLKLQKSRIAESQASALLTAEKIATEQYDRMKSQQLGLRTGEQQSQRIKEYQFLENQFRDMELRLKKQIDDSRRFKKGSLTRQLHEMFFGDVEYGIPDKYKSKE